MTPALAGIRVLDLTRLLPGAAATQLLRDFGADVIKVEPPEGDYARTLLTAGGDSPIFEATNRGKRSIVLNLKDAASRDTLLRLVDTADVLIEGFRPGVMDRLQLSHATLLTRNPRLIVAAITGYGQCGPHRDLAGHDINYMALAGVLGLVGAKDGPPVIPGVQIADLAGGSTQAVIGILLALLARERTGVGQIVDVSMTAGAASLLTLARATQSTATRGDDTLSGRFACYNVYRCKDGRWLTVGALEQHFWLNLCRALERPDLIAGQFEIGPRQDEIKAALTACFLTRTAAEWFTALGPLDTCVAPVLTPAEAAAEFRPTPALSSTPARTDGVAPKLGQHNPEILP